MMLHAREASLLYMILTLVQTTKATTTCSVKAKMTYVELPALCKRVVLVLYAPIFYLNSGTYGYAHVLYSVAHKTQRG